jgi:hypothetical protein
LCPTFRRSPSACMMFRTGSGVIELAIFSTISTESRSGMYCDGSLAWNRPTFVLKNGFGDRFGIKEVSLNHIDTRFRQQIGLLGRPHSCVYGGFLQRTVTPPCKVCKDRSSTALMSAFIMPRNRRLRTYNPQHLLLVYSDPCSSRR